MNKLVIAIAALMIGSVFAEAQTRTPNINERQINQNQRINQGIGSGELTRREAGKLKAQQAKIQRTKTKAKSDGVVTSGERARIQHQQNVASRNIYRQKHDGQKRF